MSNVPANPAGPASSGEGESAKSHLFTNVENLKFGYSEEQNKIETVSFLESSRNVVLFVERMGKVFAPLKYDMNGNITKITKKYQEDQVGYKYIDDMILAEKAQGKNVATDALQWLRRGLHFITSFFDLIIEQSQFPQESLVILIKMAYDEVLRRYHGWMGVQLFNIMCRFAPSRTELFKILTSGETYSEEQVLKDMTIFKRNLFTVIKYLITFYNDNNLEVNEVV